MKPWATGVMGYGGEDLTTARSSENHALILSVTEAPLLSLLVPHTTDIWHKSKYYLYYLSVIGPPTPIMSEYWS